MMKLQLEFFRPHLTFAAVAVALGTASHIVAAPQEPPALGARRIWNAQLKTKQTKGQKAATQTAAKSQPKPVYEANTSDTAPLRQNDAVVGITIWRLRQSRAGDDKTAILSVPENDRVTEYTPVRVAAGTPLAADERVRLSIEAPRAGFLYVIDREQYADGTMSEPYLIFPTLRTRSGDNKVKAGRVIEIPDQQDNPPYFTLRRRRDDQTAEVLIVLVAREPLAEVKIGRDALKLSKEQFARWDSQWGADVERFELAGGVGRPWTAAEKEAGLGARLLVQEEPMPQTLYRVRARPGEPVMLTVPLEIRK